MDLFRMKHIMTYRKSKALNTDEQLLFLRRLHRLLIDGYSLINALKVMEWNKDFIKTSKVINEALLNGEYIDEAFQAANFHQTIVAYLYFVRFNQDFIISIEKAMHIFSQRVENRKKLTQVIRYPIILSLIFIILLFFLKINILPSFIDLFQYSQDSSSAIFISINIINFLITLFIIVIVLVVLGIFGWKFYLRKLPIEEQMTYFQKLPIYRSFLRMITSYYFTTHLSLFIQTGMSMNEILQQMAHQEKLPIIAHYAKMMQTQLQNGFELGHLIKHFYFIESQIAYIFDQHQNNKALEQDLRAYADFVIENLELKTKKSMMLIQPIFFIVLACFIVFIYLALMWPMFQIIQTV